MTANEIIDETLKISDFPDLDSLRETHWHDCVEDFDNHHFINGYHWPDKKFRFKPDWKNIGPRGHELPTLPDHWDAPGGVDENHPFRLMTPPARNFLNTTFNNTPTSLKREQKPTLIIHPDDAEKQNIIDDMTVTIGNTLGQIDLNAKLSDGAKPGVLVAEGIWSNASHSDQKGINQLVSSEIAAPNGGVVYHDNGVWLRA